MNDDQNSKYPFIDPVKWCRHIVNTSYIIVAFVIVAHIIWYFTARSVLAYPPDIYLKNYIILPTLGLFTLVFLIDLLIRSHRFSALIKESLSLLLIIIICFYLSISHPIAKVLFGSFILAIFASTIFANIKLTRNVFWASFFSLLLIGIKYYFSGQLNSDMTMQIFVSWFMFSCSYLIAKILIRYDYDNLTTLKKLDNKQQNILEQLKLDPFTGLYNKKTFDDTLQLLIEECQKKNEFLALAIIDVDNFKHVNDYYGHSAGDRVLQYLSSTLQRIESENIHAYRVGGDEFAIIFTNQDSDTTYKICNDLLYQMESCPLRATDEKKITLSCGIVCANSQNLVAESLIKAADSAMYSAKKTGRNQVVINKVYN